MKQVLTLLLSLSLMTWAAGSMTVEVTTKSYDGNYAPSHIIAVWITDTSNKFVKSLFVSAKERKPSLFKWIETNPTQNAVDAVTGATINKHKKHLVTWNLTDAAGTAVPMGTYRVWIEMTENDHAGPSLFQDITLGDAAQTITPTAMSYQDSLGYAEGPTEVFTELRILYTPQVAVTPAP